MSSLAAAEVIAAHAAQKILVASPATEIKRLGTRGRYSNKWSKDATSSSWPHY